MDTFGGATFAGSDILASNICSSKLFGFGSTADESWKYLGKAGPFAKFAIFKRGEEEGLNVFDIQGVTKALNELGDKNPDKVGRLVNNLSVTGDRFGPSVQCSLLTGLLRYCGTGSLGGGCPELPYRLLDAFGEQVGVHRLGDALKGLSGEPVGAEKILKAMLTAFDITWDSFLGLAGTALTKALGSQASKAVPVITGVVTALAGGPESKGDVQSGNPITWLGSLLSAPEQLFEKVEGLDLNELLGYLRELPGELRQRVTEEASKDLGRIGIEVGLALLKSVGGPVAYVLTAVKIYDLIQEIRKDPEGKFAALEGTLKEVTDAAANGACERAADRFYQLLLQSGPLVIKILANVLKLDTVLGRIKGTIERIKAKIEELLVKLFTYMTKPIAGLLDKINTKPGGPLNPAGVEMLTRPVPLTGSSLANAPTGMLQRYDFRPFRRTTGALARLDPVKSTSGVTGGSGRRVRARSRGKKLSRSTCLLLRGRRRMRTMRPSRQSSPRATKSLRKRRWQEHQSPLVR